MIMCIVFHIYTSNFHVADSGNVSYTSGNIIDLYLLCHVVSLKNLVIIKTLNFQF